jgi:hypothetical protein
MNGIAPSELRDEKVVGEADWRTSRLPFGQPRPGSAARSTSPGTDVPPYAEHDAAGIDEDGRLGKVRAEQVVAGEALLC